MSRVVADSNAVLGIVMGDAFGPQARDAIGEADVLVPSHFWLEVGNVLARRTRVTETPLPIARAAMDLCGRLVHHTVDSRRLADSAFELALLLRHDAYDCCYLAAAMRYEAPLVTADRDLASRACAAGLGDHVVLVE